MPDTTGLIPLVGRERELTALRRRLAAAAEGTGGVLLLAGEPGIGKTRLAREVAAEARAAGSAVLWGACYEGEGSPPYGPWVEALGEHVRAAGAERLRAELGPGASLLAQLVPDLWAALPQAHWPTPLDASNRFLLYETVTRLLLATARDRPVLLVLDDLQWADGDSLGLLRHVARQARTARLIVLGLYRDEALATHPSLADLLAFLRREADSETLAIQGFDQGEVRAFLAHAAGQELPGALVHGICAETGGNPFYVREVFTHLVEERLLVRRADRWSVEVSIAEIGVPEGVRRVLARRLARLTPATNAMLRWASAFTGGVEFRVLQSLMGQDEETLLGSLEEAQAAGLIHAVRGRRERYDFVHAIVRHTIYDEISPSRRVRLHGRIAEEIERLYEANPEPHLAELAHHYCLAAPGGDAWMGVAYARRAGDRAAALLAYEEGTRFYRMALAAQELDDNPDEWQRCELLLSLGDTLNRAGDAPAARDAFERAAAAAHALTARAGAAGVAGLLARAGLGLGWWVEGGEDRTQIRLLREALDALPPDDSVPRATVLGRLAQALRFTVSREERAALSREAVAMARRLGDPAALASVLRSSHWALFATEDLDQRMAVATDLMRLGEEQGDVEVTYQGHSLRLMDLLEAGDIEGADRELESLSNMAEPMRQPLNRWEVALTRAMRALFDGRLQEGEALARQALDTGRHMGSILASRSFDIQMFWLRRQRGQLDDGDIRQLATGTEQVPALRTTFQARLACVFAELGRDAEARAELERIAGGDLAALPHDSNWLYTLMYLAEACAILGDLAHATVLYNQLLPFAGRNIVQSRPRTVCYGSAERYLGLLAGVLERWEQAAQHFQRALAANARMGTHPHVALTQHDFAAMLLRAERRVRQAELRTQALTLAGEALATARELGMTALEGRARTLLDAAAGMPEAATARPAHRASYPDGLTEREVEVLRLLAAGRTNREIADELVISLTTVQRHVANLYAKIGARGRVDATGYALRHGIAPPP